MSTFFFKLEFFLFADVMTREIIYNQGKKQIFLDFYSICWIQFRFGVKFA